jgi:ATP-dependent exoDNAse (exonuclease V) alpha subunit
LKGYAGSGKTTILKGLIDYLEAQEREVDVIAPTGKAAKVLREKTARGTTIHRGIYNFEQLLPLKLKVRISLKSRSIIFFPSQIRVTLIESSSWMRHLWYPT